MRTRDKRAASRRMKGRYSARLSDRPRGRSAKSFRVGPEFFRLVVESLSEYALITTDKDLKISSWSGPAAAMFGYEESDAIGAHVSLIFTPEDVARGVDKKEFRTALENGREDDERWHVRQDGRRLWCYGLSFPLKDGAGGVRGFVKLIRDDSGRKSKDDALRVSEERLRLAVESTGLGTWDYDAVKQRLHLSTRAAALFGLGAGAATRIADVLERVHPDDVRQVRGDIDRCLGPAGECRSEMEYRVRDPDGRTRWIRVLVHAFPKEEALAPRAPERVIGTVVDITELRERQQEADESSRELEQQVKRRTARLSALNHELETFAYSASHDLRASLRKIAAFSHAIQQSAGAKLSAAETGYFDRVRAAATHMHRLIDDMLKLSQVTRKPVELVECDLGAIVREIAEELRGSEPERRVEFVIASRAPARGDKELLTVALRNLLENAWKFTGRHASARIEFGVKEEDGERVYFVKDDGAGFDMRYAHKLYAAFQRLHASEDFPGTGVGLGIVERVVKRHRGRIWAEAEVEKGAAFFFTLYTESE